MSAVRLASVLLTALALLTCAKPALAQIEPVRDVPQFWQDDRRIAAGGAAEVLGIREPFAVLAMRLEGGLENVWQEIGRVEEKAEARAPDLRADLLRSTKDVHKMPFVGGRRRAEWKPWERDTYDLFCEAVRFAALTPDAARAFANSAAEHRGIKWGHMFREPWKYRGQVIPVKGRLKLLRVQDAPLGVQQDGIKKIYEGWVFTDTPGANPVCVDFITLPKGMEVGEKVDYQVEFNGYFLMRYHYLTSGRGWRDTLLFIAPTVSTPPGPRREAKDIGFGRMSRSILTGMIVVIVATVILVAVLGWWFRRGDRHFHERQTQVRAGMFAESEMNAERPEEPTPD
jgi:hypothetical protein